MVRPRGTALVFLVVGLMVPGTRLDAQVASHSEREAMYQRYLEFPSYIKGGSIEPHWLADESSFWYAEGTPANTIIWKVDPKANTKMPLLDAAHLRKRLTSVLGHEPPYQGVPFGEFSFLDGEKKIKFTVEGKEFIFQLNTDTLTPATALSKEEKSRLVPQIVRKRLDEPPVIEVLSPDGQWFVGVKDHNLWLRSSYDGRSQPLTTDGVKDYEWVEKYLRGRSRWAWWSPDSLKLAVKKVDSRLVPSVPVVHWLKPTVDVEWVKYPRAGGPIFQTELFIVDILSKQQVQVDIGAEPDQYVQIVGWRPAGSELLFLRMDRLRKRLDLMAANPTTGSARVVLTETQETFVVGFEFDLAGGFTLLENGRRFVWSSEKDGWNHLYLYDLDGTLIRRLTEGDYPVVQVVAVDEKAGWVYFTAHGEKQRPYDVHLYRVRLDGGEITQLTEATGHHQVQFSPSREFFLDTHSTVDRPPVVELRWADGRLVRVLSQANIDVLKELKWTPPEEFVVKAADGETNLYGVLYKPYNFDANKKYPVIEHIYAGPQISVVPRSFVSPWVDAYFHARALVQLGFIVFMVDGRGTPGRGKEFQDVVYGNFGRHEIPDHVAALKHLAEERPYMDLSRVGIIGGSWGGYFALRALLLASEVYHVGIADAPDVNLYHDGPYAYEAYMGLPQDNKEGYEYGSNLRLAGNLKGKLLLIAGTSDPMVFSGTMKMVEALIREEKPYDLIVLPEQPHDYSGRGLTYFREAVRRYFQEHLKP